MATKFLIDIGESSRLTLIEHHMPSTADIVKIVDTEIHLGAQAKLVHGKIVHGDSAAAHLTMTRVHVAKGAYYDNFTLIKGGRLIRNEIDVSLAGPLAQCNLNGIMLLRGHQHADTTTRITHLAPYGTSSEFYKSVVADQARGVFQGKILVAKDAQKSDGNQLSRALLLSDQAEMDAKPELEIYADDVKCSHGSTVGDLDAEAMFYLRTRGLNETEARALLIHGFIEEAIDLIHVPEWREFCRFAAEEWLYGQN
jgi:Fe-S cluster assembly protein SufD